MAFAGVFARVALGPRHFPGCLRGLRWVRGICRGVCAGCAGSAAFAGAFAQVALGLTAFAGAFARVALGLAAFAGVFAQVAQVSRHSLELLGKSVLK